MPFPVQSSPGGMIPAERIKPLNGETPPKGSMDWIWYVGDQKAPDVPKPEGADYHTYYKCKSCDVSFRAWKFPGKPMKCLWCSKFISEFDV